MYHRVSPCIRPLRTADHRVSPCIGFIIFLAVCSCCGACRLHSLVASWSLEKDGKVKKGPGRRALFSRGIFVDVRLEHTKSLHRFGWLLPRTRPQLLHVLRAWFADIIRMEHTKSLRRPAWLLPRVSSQVFLVLRGAWSQTSCGRCWGTLRTCGRS